MTAASLNCQYPFVRAFGGLIGMREKSILLHQQTAQDKKLEDTVVLALGDPIYLKDLSEPLRDAIKVKGEAIRETYLGAV